MDTGKAPYRVITGDTGLFYYVEGPSMPYGGYGMIGAHYANRSEAEHLAEMLNDAWTLGRRTGRDDIRISEAIKLERMKPEHNA